MDLHGLMRDPTTAGSRIYVGNLSELIGKDEIQGHFARYGTIKGVLLNRGFGFLQFDNDQSAQNAIQNENNTMFHNRKLIVRTAVRSQTFLANKTTEVSSSSTDGNVGTTLPTPPANATPEQPAMPVGQDLNRTARPAWTIRNQRGGKAGGVAPSTQTSNDNNIRDRSPLGGNDKVTLGTGNSDSVVSVSSSSSSISTMDMTPANYSMPPKPLPMPPRGPPMPQYSQYNMPPHQPRYFDRNDCEIIVVTKALTNYAEAIEDRLRCQGLTVDLLFPNEDVPMGKVLASISSRGCLFAVLVTPEHEEYRTISVHILYGQPSEHRNLPVDDAIDFIATYFNEKIRGRSSRILPKAVQITPTTSYAAPPLNARHPDAIQTLINLLAENRPITVLQYDRVINYLKERRTLQLKAEVGDAPNIPVPPPVDPEAELQKKIFDILNKPSITNSSIPQQQQKQQHIPQTSISMTTAASMPPVTQPQILNDPKVQKALDSLLQGNLFNF